MSATELLLTRATLERFQAGDPAAFEAVIRAHAGLVRSIAARFWRSIFEQEEAMQEIWLHAFRQRASLDPDRADEFRGWLAVLARRRALDLLRAAGTPLAAADLLDEERGGEGQAAPPGQEQAAQQRELDEAVAAFARKLKPAWRQFFELHFVQALDYEEVARRLSISRLRCKYMKKVLAARARRHAPLMAALGRRGGKPGAS